MHQLYEAEVWLRQGECEGDFPPRYCSEQLMWSSHEWSGLMRDLAAVDRH